MSRLLLGRGTLLRNDMALGRGSVSRHALGRVAMSRHALGRGTLPSHWMALSRGTLPRHVMDQGRSTVSELAQGRVTVPRNELSRGTLPRHFIEAPKDCTVEETTKLFLMNVVKYWGLPKFIISDRDSRFIGKFWMELFKLMGTELHFSTNFHPQTYGHTEWVNALLELYLRHFVSANQTDWAKLLDVAQFSYNLQRSEATERSPFEIVTGQ